MREKVYIVSGGFDPIHEGHLSMIDDCMSRGASFVVVLLNSDKWLTRKKGKPFMNYNTRSAICSHLRNVRVIGAFNDDDGSVCDGLVKVRAAFPDYDLVFANGGDRTEKNIPELEICNKEGISVEFGVGGSFKMNSSSKILLKWNKK